MAGRVRVLPAGIVIETGDDETVLAAAHRQGYWWPTACFGDCECGICYMVVEDGADRLSPKQAAEEQRLSEGLKAGEPRARLACQTKVHGEVTVTRKGVKAGKAVPLRTPH